VDDGGSFCRYRLRLAKELRVDGAVEAADRALETNAKTFETARPSSHGLLPREKGINLPPLSTLWTGGEGEE
jgi:hypothetical protein